VKEGVFNSVDQMRYNSVKSKGDSFLTFIGGYEFKHNNLSYFVDFSLSEMLVYKPVSQASDGQRIDALTHTIFWPTYQSRMIFSHSPETYYCRKKAISFSSLSFTYKI